MNKEEIKKALECCCDYYGCTECPFRWYGCKDKIIASVFELITEQEKKIENLNGIIDYADKEIKRLKAELEEERDERWNAQDDLVCYCSEEPDKIKRAKIDVLNELWEKVKDKGVDYKIGMRALGEEFDELIKEIEK